MCVVNERNYVIALHENTGKPYVERFAHLMMTTILPVVFEISKCGTIGCILAFDMILPLFVKNHKLKMLG